MTCLKICGIQNPENAKALLPLKLDYIGLVFYPQSKRFVTQEVAQSIAQVFMGSATRLVGVFVDQNADEIIETTQTVGLDAVQLHGENARKALFDLPCSLIKIYATGVDQDGRALSLDQRVFEYLNVAQDFLLFDHPNAGSGMATNLSQVKPLANGYRYFVAGGIGIDNIAEITTQTKPYAVDVSSGAESGIFGIKDDTKVQKLQRKLRGED